MTQTIPLIDLQAQRQRLGEPLEAAISEAVRSGQWVLGPQVHRLEEELAAFVGVTHAVTCANGTDALLLLLKAWDIGPGDAVFVPAFTFAATAEVVVLAGAIPVFVDVLEDTFNMDPSSLESAIAMIRRDGKLARKAVIPVDLFGQPADTRRLAPIAKREGLKMLCDAAQSFGARLDGKRTGAIGDAAATSFFPAKPLGCYGDGGACFTADDALAKTLRSLRNHGEGDSRHEHVRVGMNSRLDTIQAAILIEKLKIFPEEIEARNKIAARYNEAFGHSNVICVPRVIDGAEPVWAQYTLVVNDRTKLQKDLRAEGIPTAVHYRVPLSAQPAYRGHPAVPTPVAMVLSERVINLPMHPYLDAVTQDRIVAAVLQSVG